MECPVDMLWSIGWVSGHGSFLCSYAGLLWYWESDTLEAAGSPSQVPIVRVFEETYYMVIFGINFQNIKMATNSGNIDERPTQFPLKPKRKVLEISLRAVSEHRTAEAKGSRTCISTDGNQWPSGLKERSQVTIFWARWRDRPRGAQGKGCTIPEN